MRLKSPSTVARVVALLLLSAAGAAAQVVQIGGRVTLKQGNGRVVPIEGAIVDIYRTDINQKFHATTDKRGGYILYSIPVVGTYTVAVSAPGARPDYREGVRFGQQNILDFTLVPGDGSRVTPEQVRTVEEKNRKITLENEVVSRTYQAGNEALMAGRLDDAIAQYQEGLAARPDEPALLTNLAEALRRRGADRFNAAIKDPDNNRKGAGVEAAKKDWTKAAQASRNALDIIKGAPPAGPGQQQIYERNKLAAASIYALAIRLVATKVDITQAGAAWKAYQEYIAVETDPAKKSQFRAASLQMLFDAGAVELAIAEARKVLATEPDDVTANRVLGLSLFASGEKKNYQAAADHLQRYVDLAPDTDPLKGSVKESLDYLKTVENVEPRKGQATPPPPRRRI